MPVLSFVKFIPSAALMGLGDEFTDPQMVRSRNSVGLLSLRRPASLQT
jgi:hypothetical protein